MRAYLGTGFKVTESQEQPKDDKQQGQNEASTKSGHYFKHYKRGSTLNIKHFYNTLEDDISNKDMTTNPG